MTSLNSGTNCCFVLYNEQIVWQTKCIAIKLFHVIHAFEIFQYNNLHICSVVTVNIELNTVIRVAFFHKVWWTGKQVSHLNKAYRLIIWCIYVQAVILVILMDLPNLLFIYYLQNLLHLQYQRLTLMWQTKYITPKKFWTEFLDQSLPKR